MNFNSKSRKGDFINGFMLMMEEFEMYASIKQHKAYIKRWTKFLLNNTGFNLSTSDIFIRYIILTEFLNNLKYYLDKSFDDKEFQLTNFTSKFKVILVELNMLCNQKEFKNRDEILIQWMLSTYMKERTTENQVKPLRNCLKKIFQYLAKLSDTKVLKNNSTNWF
ncbi:hypothetical protein [Pedobacter flavus]|uniref:Phage integrase SAM-like domain-containing protein n=1 Tax=Pedobacter flavus TaxID=3113906 RepID=A0ABU7GYS0_9SPHI|nr:hypothetical protein [Pedobacter sp. VNH31]MEE1884169.1 hypothetical protein [Pedobacter sp. VNH31]